MTVCRESRVSSDMFASVNVTRPEEDSDTQQLSSRIATACKTNWGDYGIWKHVHRRVNKVDHSGKSRCDPSKDYMELSVSSEAKHDNVDNFVDDIRRLGNLPTRIIILEHVLCQNSAFCLGEEPIPRRSMYSILE